MKWLKNYYMHVNPHQTSERRWILLVAMGSVGSLFLFLLSNLTSSGGYLLLPLFWSDFESSYTFVESKLKPLPISTLPPPPRLAYLISCLVGDGSTLKQTLQALYHPRNQYVVHLDLTSRPEELLELKNYVEGDPTFLKFGNVRVVKKVNLVTYRGPSMVANTLHVAAILLREGGHWGWFINLSASDYPLDTQDGSAWMALSRPFIDYCIRGWDNLPRTVLMYYANFISSPEGYFHTVICNAREFRNTTVNSDLHFILWDNPPEQHPHDLSLTDIGRMIDSNAPFARKFRRVDPVLDKIDSNLLSRDPGRFVPGGWCIGSRENGTNPCSTAGDPTLLLPGPGAKRLEKLISSLLSAKKFRPRQCK